MDVERVALREVQSQGSRVATVGECSLFGVEAVLGAERILVFAVEVIDTSVRLAHPRLLII